MQAVLDTDAFAGLSAGDRVVVAMSGGVDSAVVAGLAKAAGYEVVGITLQLYDHGRATARKGACCAGADIHDARRVAERLAIPHYVLDYERRFAEAVIADFADSYAAGETPVPCVRCNQRVKFTDLLQVARELGAKALLTGHYVRRVMAANGVELHRAADTGRDQSYFLFATTAVQLDYLRFPLGGLAGKATTRAFAAGFDLPIAAKPDSQDICFVPDGRYANVLARLRPEAMRPGEIVDGGGRVLGRHEGIGGFTIGQRRGLRLGQAEALYVVGLDAETAQVVVGPRQALACDGLRLRQLNWLAEPLAGPRLVAARVRSTRPPVAAEIVADAAGGALLRFVEPEEAAAPGQACAVYDGARVLGGGWIVGAERRAAA